MPDNVTCAACGFLSVRVINSRELAEAELPLRERGEAVWVHGARLHVIYPECFKRAIDFKSELGTDFDTELLTAIVNEFRSCDQFFPWSQGSTPKEHAEIQRLEEQREYNERMLSEERAWREGERKERASEATRVEDRHRQNSRDAERRFWLGFVGAVLVTIVAQSFLAWLKPTVSPAVNVTVPPIHVVVPPGAAPNAHPIPEPIPTQD